MTSSRSFRTILLALTVGGLGAFGCVISVNDVDCSECNADVDPDPLCHSSFNESTGECECDPGYVFENNNPNDFECEREDSKPGTGDCGTDPNTTVNASGDCECVDGFVWCSSDPDDLTCCGDGDTDTDPTVAGTDDDTTNGQGSETDAETDDDETDTQADTGSGGETGPASLPDCDDSLQDMFACTNNGGIDSVQDGEQYLCSDGEWTQIDLDQGCIDDGQGDFSYGCYINDSDEIENFCGDGPGTACTDDDDACDNDTLLQSCLFGKLTNIDCEEFCTGDKAKTQTDNGSCDSDTNTCCCFDEGDEGNCQ